MKKMMAVWLMVAFVWTGAGMAAALESGTDARTAAGGTENLVHDEENFIEGVPNPIISYLSLAELEAAVGYPVSAPEKIGKFQLAAYESIQDTAQLWYEMENLRLCWRMSPGEWDNSGDYTKYDDSCTQTIGDVNVTLKGSGGAISLALWTLNGYSYSLGAQACPLSAQEMEKLLCALMP